MKQYEYTQIAQPREFSGFMYSLREYGFDGWELCAIDYGMLIFKREIQNETV